MARKQSGGRGRFFFNDTATTEIYTLSLRDALPISVTWQAALSYCENLERGGTDDWRLPNIRELESLVDEDRYDAASEGEFSYGLV